MLRGYLADADALVAQGSATAGAVDAAMRLGAGHSRGPFESRERGEASPGFDPEAAPFDPPVVIVGSGRMAAGIMQAVACAGMPVLGIARARESADRLAAIVDASIGRAVTGGKLSPEAARRATDSFGVTFDVAAAEQAGLVLEAVVEDLAVKQDLLGGLSERVRADVPFATNTSSFTVAETMAGVGRQRPTLALHFFNPAPAMRLVEVVAGADSGGDIADRGAAWAHAVGKTPVQAPDERGFLVNRLLIPMLNDAVRVHEAGTPVADVDAAMTRHAGHPMGPFTLIDMIGIDVMVAALDALAVGRDERIRPARTLRELLAAGRLGRKSGGGFLEGTTQ